MLPTATGQGRAPPWPAGKAGPRLQMSPGLSRGTQGHDLPLCPVRFGSWWPAVAVALRPQFSFFIFPAAARALSARPQGPCPGGAKISAPPTRRRDSGALGWRGAPCALSTGNQGLIPATPLAQHRVVTFDRRQPSGQTEVTQQVDGRAQQGPGGGGDWRLPGPEGGGSRAAGSSLSQAQGEMPRAGRGGDTQRTPWARHRAAAPALGTRETRRSSP